MSRPGPTPIVRHCPNPDCAGLVRDGRIAEYDGRVESCLDCGTRLLSGPAPDADPALEYNGLQTVFIADNVVQGHLVAGAIEGAGIPVYLKGEMLQGAIGELAADVRNVEVQVPVERVAEARAIAMRFEGPFEG